MKAAALHALIRNDEALVEHYLGRLQGEDAVTGSLRTTLLLRLGFVRGRMNARRDELAKLSAALPPACTSRAPNLNGDNSGPGTCDPEPSAAAR